MELKTVFVESPIVLVEIGGEVDAHSAADLDTTLNDLFAQGQRRLVLDFSQVTYIASAGLRSILGAHQKAGHLGGELRLFGLRPNVLKVFDIAGFTRLLRVTSTWQDALKDW